MGEEFTTRCLYWQIGGDAAKGAVCSKCGTRCEARTEWGDTEETERCGGIMRVVSVDQVNKPMLPGDWEKHLTGDDVEAHRTTNPHWMTIEELIAFFVRSNFDELRDADAYRAISMRGLDEACIAAQDRKPWRHLVPKTRSPAAIVAEHGEPAAYLNGTPIYVDKAAPQQPSKTAAFEEQLKHIYSNHRVKVLDTIIQSDGAPAPREVADHVWDMIKKDHHDKRLTRANQSEGQDAIDHLLTPPKIDAQSEALGRAAQVPLPGERSMRATLLIRKD